MFAEAALNGKMNKRLKRTSENVGGNELLEETAQTIYLAQKRKSYFRHLFDRGSELTRDA